MTIEETISSGNLLIAFNLIENTQFQETELSSKKKINRIHRSNSSVKYGAVSFLIKTCDK
jgi:hypothetical protein